MGIVVNRRSRWVLDFYDQNGKRQRLTMPKGTTKKSAEKLLREIQDQVSNGVYMPVQEIPTFYEAGQEWLEHKKMNIRSSTWAVYEGHTRNHFDEFLHLRVDRITTKMIEQYINKCQKQGMNISTLRKILVTFGQILALATKRGYCIRNPLTEADRPRSQGTEFEEEEKMTILNLQQISAFLNEVKGQKYKTLFRLAIVSGARQGELLGLKWSDILWKDKQIFIRRTFNNGQFFATKTKTSRRRVDIGPQTIKALKEWRLACPPGELNLVFPTAKGTPMNHNNMVNRYFRPALKAAGIDRIRFHDLRHTYASLLFERGENPKYIQNQLGHANPMVTFNVYAHLMKRTNQESAMKLEQLILNG
ncbi:MAG: site-specific integrase [Desulfobacter sp.]|nr:MAG: site-specific integrase [Desulfobacter sp.]